MEIVTDRKNDEYRALAESSAWAGYPGGLRNVEESLPASEGGHAIGGSATCFSRTGVLVLVIC